MPYKNKDEQRVFQKEWLRDRKKRFFKDKKCKKCGSNKNLTLHHRDPSKKIDHHIWSWAPERFWAEVKKCDVLCEKCHEEKNIKDNRKRENDKNK